MFPARPVPVPAQGGGASRHDHDVPDARRDLLLASGAYVGLSGLERVHSPDLDVIGGDLLFATHGPILLERARRVAT
jgi:hypothetical protein